MEGYVKKTNCRVYGSNPCWVCQNAGGGCEWTDEDPETGHTAFKPVPGWEAIEATLRADKGQPRVTTFRILRCPKFKPIPGAKPQTQVHPSPHSTKKRPVIAISDDGTETRYPSIEAAKTATKGSHSQIRTVCNAGKGKSGGYRWRYAEE